MPQSGRRVWTLGRQLIGNLVPLLISGPFLLLGLKGYPSTGLQGSTLALLVAFPVTGWLATNFFGNLGSAGLKAKIESKLSRDLQITQAERVFVGFARPGHVGLLDPHEDIGLLVIHPDRLQFMGFATHVELAKADVLGVAFRRNPHTWLGLGRWVSVEGRSDGRAVRLLVEPREAHTLLANRRLGTELRAKLLQWSRS